MFLWDSTLIGLYCLVVHIILLLIGIYNNINSFQNIHLLYIMNNEHDYLLYIPTSLYLYSIIKLTVRFTAIPLILCYFIKYKLCLFLLILNPNLISHNLLVLDLRLNYMSRNCCKPVNNKLLN